LEHYPGYVTPWKFNQMTDRDLKKYLDSTLAVKKRSLNWQTRESISFQDNNKMLKQVQKYTIKSNKLQFAQKDTKEKINRDYCLSKQEKKERGSNYHVLDKISTNTVRPKSQFLKTISVVTQFAKDESTVLITPVSKKFMATSIA
jgi:cytochrome oxidase Cu insertion factor (SCO1/SenC/PrrC family)